MVCLLCEPFVYKSDGLVNVLLHPERAGAGGERCYWTAGNFAGNYLHSRDSALSKSDCRMILMLDILHFN
jgi:hypothetical protein